MTAIESGMTAIESGMTATESGMTITAAAMTTEFVIAGLTRNPVMAYHWIPDKSGMTIPAAGTPLEVVEQRKPGQLDE